MPTVEDDNAPCAAAFGDIYEPLFLLCLLLEFADGGRAGVDHGKNTIDLHGITKADVHEAVIHRGGDVEVKGKENLLDILHLLTQFFNLILHFHPQIGYGGVGNLGGQSIHFSEEFLQKKV